MDLKSQRVPERERANERRQTYTQEEEDDAKKRGETVEKRLLEGGRGTTGGREGETTARLCRVSTAKKRPSE